MMTDPLRRCGARCWLRPLVAVAALTAVVLGVGYGVEFERSVSPHKLPLAAQEFLAEHYPQQTPALVLWAWDDFRIRYEVFFHTGTQLRFRYGGALKAVDSRQQPIPAGIVPEAVREYVGRHFPGAVITKLEHERREWEVRLSNGVELSFDNRNFFPTGYDD